MVTRMPPYNIFEELPKIANQVREVSEDLGAELDFAIAAMQTTFDLAIQKASTARTDGPKYKHKANCLWATPLPTGAGFWGCDCGLDKLLLDLEDYEVAAPGAPQAEPTKEEK